MPTQHPTKPCGWGGGGGRLPREALLGESPNKAVRSHPRTYLLDQHFQNHRREPKERSRGGTETGGWRETASPRLVLDAWAVPGGAGKGASSLAASGCKGCSLPRSSGTRNKRGVGEPQLHTQGLRRRVPRSAQSPSRLAPTSAGPGAGSVGLRRRRRLRDAARGGGEGRRAAARAATAEPGPLARVYRAGAAAQDGKAMLLRGTPGASLALLGKLPRPHDPP